MSFINGACDRKTITAIGLAGWLTGCLDGWNQGDFGDY